jgi:hypothetical protein
LARADFPDVCNLATRILPYNSLVRNNTIILPSAIVAKRLDSYYQVDITRKDLVILREEKRRNNSRNIVFIIAQLPSPEPLESKIPAKHLDHEPKALDDLSNLTELKPNT